MGDAGGSQGTQLRRVALSACAITAAGVASGALLAAAHRLRHLLQKRRGRPLEDDGASNRMGSWSRAYSLVEVYEHNDLETGIWIILHGQVYDVTKWLDDHPGGKFLLLAFAGQDATESWETIGHSPIAKRMLHDLHIGHISNSKDHRGALVKSKSKHQFERVASITGGYLVAGHQTSSPLWEVKSFGFLPSRDPVSVDALRSTAFEALAELADLIPAMSVTNSFRSFLDGDVELQQKLRRCADSNAIESLSEDQLQRAFTVAGFVMIAYWRGGTHPYANGISAELPRTAQAKDDSKPPPCRLPDYLSLPLLALSKKVGRPPTVDYVSTVLYNWERIDPKGPIVVDNIRCTMRLTGLGDEEWFFKTHVVIESEAAPAVSAMIGAMKAENDSELLGHLHALEEALWRVVRACMPLMYERAADGVPRCSEHIFYQIIRPLISTGSIIFEGTDDPTPRMLHGPSGAMSSLLPAVDAVLGIQTSSEKLAKALKMFQGSMPPEHVDFLTRLRNQQSVRERIQYARPPVSEPNEQHEALVKMFNRCISRVLDFRWQHWQYVKNYIMKPGSMSFATGTGGTSFDYLQQHITDTEQARLRLSEDFSRMYTPGTPGDFDLPSASYPLSSYERNLAEVRKNDGFWSVDGPHGLLSAQPMPGFNELERWYTGLPQQLHRTARALVGLAARLPALCISQMQFWRAVEAKEQDLVDLRYVNKLLVDTPEVSWEAGREWLMIVLTHIAAGMKGSSRGTPYEKEKLPRFIDNPLKLLAKACGRYPHVDLTELVLGNWTFSCTPGETGAAHTNGDGEQRKQVVLGFLACPDEEWYRDIHLVLHSEAREAIAAIRLGQHSATVGDDRGVMRSLELLCSWLNKFCDWFDAQFEQKDSRTEVVMMSRLSRFVAQSWFTDEKTACWVYCSGSSALMPVLHAFLGIKEATPQRLQSSDVEALWKCLQEWRNEITAYMPVQHRRFLEELKKPGANVRQYCLKRFGASKISVELLYDIEVAYNDTLNALVRFLSRRMHLVSRFFPPLASVFGNLHSEIEAGMRKDRLRLLQMRQRVDRLLEK